MKYPVIAAFFIVFCCTFCNAQTNNKSKNSALSFEVGKTELIYNLNFDMNFVTGILAFVPG